MMHPRDFVRQLWVTLSANRLRTGLTMFGIVWAVAFSLVMGGMGDALRDAFIADIESAGSREVFLWSGHKQGEVGGYRAGRSLEFDDRTLVELRKHCPSLAHASPLLAAGTREVKHGSRVRSLTITGAEPPIHEIRNMKTAAGRTLTDDDVRNATRVAYIGDNVRERLFGSVNPVGRRIRIGGRAFVVVGVAARKGDALLRFGGLEDNDIVLVPASTARRLFATHSRNDTYALQAVTREASYRLMDEVRRVLGALYRFDVADRDALLFFNTVDNVMRVLAIRESADVLLVVVNLTTLAIGAIGLANILIVSVTERTPEIGLRRALGATRRAILVQLLGESVAIATVAGAIGVALAIGLTLLLRTLPLPPLFHAPEMPLERVAVAFLTTEIVGLAAGLIPARRAAALDPAVGLRFES
jgi:putative ABC transport system permease protein